MITTPSPGLVKSSYVNALVGTLRELSARGIGWDYASVVGSDIAFQRNCLATYFLEAKAFTHLFFLDSDVVPDVDVCARLLSADKSMIGCVYQSKAQDPQRRFWHAYPLSTTGTVTDGLMQCERIGFGAALIKRDVLNLMISKGLAQSCKARDIQYYNFFGLRPEDAGKVYAEDFSFCRRWRIDCGGEIWALLDAKIGHIGDYAYGADESYLDFLKRQGAFTPHGV